MAGIDHIFGQQDGRVVKTPSFTNRTDYIYAGYAEIRILLTKSPPGRVGAKSRPLVTVAGVSQILGQQDGRVVKAPSFTRRTD